jgi:hypothetical protein
MPVKDANPRKSSNTLWAGRAGRRIAAVKKKRSVYRPRVVGDQVMTPADVAGYAFSVLAPSRNA